MVSLREIDRSNVDVVLGLSVVAAQRAHVATTAETLAQAAYLPDVWVRAVYAVDVPVGLVAVKVPPAWPTWAVWRLLVDTRFQRTGAGRAAVELVVDHVRALGATELIARVRPGPAGPETFWRAVGFVPTGRSDELLELRLDLRS
jgi:diamine N-acetyltransferase